VLDSYRYMKLPYTLTAVAAAALALSSCAHRTPPKVNTAALSASIKKEDAALKDAQRDTKTLEEQIKEIERLTNEQ
jgi:peptidoglycan hydrolase CwlO-like protein